MIDLMLVVAGLTLLFSYILPVVICLIFFVLGMVADYKTKSGTDYKQSSFVFIIGLVPLLNIVVLYAYYNTWPEIKQRLIS